MPKVTSIKTQAVKLGEALKQLKTGVNSFLRIVCGNAKKLSEKWNKSTTTCYNRWDNPEKLTLEELAEICVKYDAHCNIELQFGSTVTKISW